MSSMSTYRSRYYPHSYEKSSKRFCGSWDCMTGWEHKTLSDSIPSRSCLQNMPPQRWVVLFILLFLRFFWCGPFLLNLLCCSFCIMFWFFGLKGCGILSPWRGIKPTPPALEVKILTTGPPRKSQTGGFKTYYQHSVTTSWTCIF